MTPITVTDTVATGASLGAVLRLPTDTAHVRIESRQYRLFQFDLGEGVARWKAAVAAAIVIPYWTVLAVLGLSPLVGTGRGGMVYIFPAFLMVWAALRRDPGGRPRYALWLDRWRFHSRRHRPMITGPLARTGPGQPYLVYAAWVHLDLAGRHPTPTRTTRQARAETSSR